MSSEPAEELSALKPDAQVKAEADTRQREDRGCMMDDDGVVVPNRSSKRKERLTVDEEFARMLPKDMPRKVRPVRMHLLSKLDGSPFSVIVKPRCGKLGIHVCRTREGNGFRITRWSQNEESAVARTSMIRIGDIVTRVDAPEPLVPLSGDESDGSLRGSDIGACFDCGHALHYDSDDEDDGCWQCNTLASKTWHSEHLLCQKCLRGCDDCEMYLCRRCKGEGVTDEDDHDEDNSDNWRCHLKCRCGSGKCRFSCCRKDYHPCR